MVREIGSEFWDVPIGNMNSLFPETTQWYIAGRSALKAIIHSMKAATSVSMPSWCCDSMIKPFIEAGFSVCFYPVFWQNGIVQHINVESDVLFLMDYFGYTGPAPDLSGYKGIVIRDLTHSIFSNSYSDADYYFGSLRKWCGLWTGGFAWAKDGDSLNEGVSDKLGYIDLRKNAMLQKKDYIDGRSSNKNYLKVFEEAEEVLEKVDINCGAKRDVELAHKLNVENIKNKRRSNAEILRKAFREWLIFPGPIGTDTPMFVPITVPNGKRNKMRSYLIEQGIYCPIHWPVSEYHKLDKWTDYIYQNELSLVCDQRYNENDMYRMVETIKAFWKEM